MSKTYCFTQFYPTLPNWFYPLGKTTLPTLSSHDHTRDLWIGRLHLNWISLETNRALGFEFELNLKSNLFNSNKYKLLKSVITNKAKEMCGTTRSLLQSSNYQGMELASLYTVSLNAVNGLSRLTKLTTSKGAGTADLVRKFLNQPIPFESNRIRWPIQIRIKSRSFTGP